MVSAAAAEPDALVVGVDANLAGLGRGWAKADRRRLTNALFVVASAEAPPSELTGVADELRLQFPWGSLLNAVVQPQPVIAKGLAAAVRPGGQAIVSLSVIARDGLAPLLDHESAWARGAAFAEATGLLRLSRVEALTAEAANALHSSWARRLGVGRSRPGWKLSFRADS